MTTCPKCGYVRKPGETAPDWQCPSCGIAYVKYHAAPLSMDKARLFVESEWGLRWYALGALAWIAFVAFLLIGLLTTFKEAPFIAVPFFGVFFWFAWKAAVKGLSSVGAYVNFGTVRLALERTPVVGGELKGYVEFESTAAALANLEAQFACTWVMMTTKSNRNAPDPVVVHSENAVLAVHVEPGHRRAPFAFAIPASAPPSGEDENTEHSSDQLPTYTWKLSLKEPHAGGDLERSFVLQVLPAGTPAQEAPSQEPALVSAIALVTANLLPLALVLVGWESVAGLVVLYWAENVVIGFYTVLRMLESGRGSAAEKIGQTFFFCVHYGMFCLVHGIFVVTMFVPREQSTEMLSDPHWSWPLMLPLLALIASHGVSFYTNYMRNGRYLSSRPKDSFMRPYPRMVLLHLFIIGGAFFITQHDTAIPALAALVIGKTVMDLMLHRRSNRA